VSQGGFDFEFAGKRAGGARALPTEGWARVDTAKSVAHDLPFFDSIIGFLEGLVPALKRTAAWTLDPPLTVERGQVLVEAATLTGPSPTAVVSRRADLVDGTMDVPAGVNLCGIR
jgi:hypothetical protein